MVSQTSEWTSVTDRLLQLGRQQATGKLLVKGDDRQWEFYFLGGELIFARGGEHRARRWYRAVRKHCPDYLGEGQQIAGNRLWEYQLLVQGIAIKKINVKQARAVLHSLLEEVLFVLASGSNLTNGFVEPRRSAANRPPYSFPLPLAELEESIASAVQLWQQWHLMGLSYLSPDRAPVWRYTDFTTPSNSPNSRLAVRRLFNGQHTLWDVAQKRNQPLIGVSRTLHHFIQHGKIEIVEIPDLPPPMELGEVEESGVVPTRSFLIACIDDSPLVGEILEGILVPAGYRILKIQDPLKEMTRLVEEKPDLIFLDLVMPPPTGYTLCNFLRNTSVFQDTPIVILSSSDGLLERVRSNLTGASEFLSKPPKEADVLAVIQKYLS